jgi:predicted enzyme related to lactoylglutathione lyase
MSEPVGTLAMVTLDSSDASRDARFWAAVLGWDISYDSPEAAMLSGPAGALGFGTEPGYVPPAWPNESGSKQFHFDLAVADLDTAEQRCVALGATVPSEQPGEGRWRVLRDPSGHLFCLTLASNWG